MPILRQFCSIREIYVTYGCLANPIYNHFFAMMTSNNDDNNEKRMAVVVTGDASLEQMSEQKKKKKNENIEVDLPISTVHQVIAPDPQKQWVKAWNDICQHNTTGKHYKPVEWQLKLITEDGFCDEMAYAAAGTHLESCNSCRGHDDNNVFMKNFFRCHPMHETIRNDHARRR